MPADAAARMIEENIDAVPSLVPGTGAIDVLLEIILSEARKRNAPLLVALADHRHHMAYPGNLSLRRDVIYEVFVRNHTPEGTFRALERDLGRIAALGTDYLWLMPLGHLR